MAGDPFDELERAIRSGGAAAAFDLLIRGARDARNFREVFSARMMQARHRAGLPLIETGEPDTLSSDARARFEKELQDAARDTGGLFLAEGDIPGAWPYFRALGDTAAIAAAIETAQPGEHLDAIIEIAFREQVHPRRGFELILEHRGVCNAITSFGALPQGDARRECLKLLLRALYDELAAAILSHIVKVEGAVPADQSVKALIAGRDWLFAENNYHTDTTHIASVLRFAPELEDEASMRLALEIADYATQLAPMYHYRGDAPFDDPYRDHAIYLRAVLRDDVDAGVEHFRAKAREGAEAGYSFPADVLIDLLVRLDRFDDAIAASLEFFGDDRPANGPSALQLCQMAGNFGKLREVARERGDLLAYAAGLIQG
jgi:hypothetical protein